VQAANQIAETDTVFNPTVVFSGMPRTYEIADIKVTGAPNYDDFLILGYTGLKVGDRVEIPGSDITNAVKRLMRQQLFAQARVKVVKTLGEKAWLEIELRTQPRISEVNYNGMKKGEREDLQERLQLMKGNQITQNIVNRVKIITEKYFSDKGFGNADVNVVLREDLSNQNEMIVDINVDKHDKVKVHKI
jgi:outer membrane protein insertion porin family